MTAQNADRCDRGCHSMPRPVSVRDDYLTPTQLVDFLDGAVTEGTLRNWRCNRTGPRYISIGRSIRYPVAEVERWLADLEARPDW